MVDKNTYASESRGMRLSNQCLGVRRKRFSRPGDRSEMGNDVRANLRGPAFVMTNPLLLAILPLSKWNKINRHCQSQKVFLPNMGTVLLKGEGRSIDLIWTPEGGDQEMIGMLFMERCYSPTSAELEEAIRNGEFDPLVINFQHALSERDTVFVYYEWFEDLEGWSGTDWSHIKLGLVDFMNQIPSYAA